MKRKVIQHGPATLIVSLPRDWVKKFDIQKGDELNIITEDNSLRITTEMSKRTKEVEMDISNLDRTTILHNIRAVYRLGYDTVKLRFNNNQVKYLRTNETFSVMSIVEFEVNKLIGYEVIEEGKNYCVIRDLQETSGKDFDQVLRRIFLLLLELYETFLEGSKNNDRALLETVKGKHDIITKFVSYCLRLLNKKTHDNPQKTSVYYHIIAYIDRITDVLKTAARDMLKYNQKLSLDVIEIVGEVGQNLQKYYKLFYTYDKTKLVEINEGRYLATKDVSKLPEKTSVAEVVIATNVSQIAEILLHLIEARTALEF